MIPEGFKILVAEDNPINQRVIILTLKRFGVTCDLADNGEEALKMHMKNNYQLIFMDMQMPVMDGVETTRQIRQYEKENSLNPTTCIIAMTANSFSNDREECFEAGMNDFINKPYTEHDLKRMISKAMSNQY